MARAGGAEVFGIERREEVQDLRDVNAAGTGRRKADDFVAAIVRGDGLAESGRVGREIGGGEDAAVRTQMRGEILGEGAAIKPVGAVGGEGAVAAGEVGLEKKFAGGERRAIGVEEGGVRAGMAAEIFRVGLDTAGVGGVEGEAFSASCAAGRRRSARVLRPDFSTRDRRRRAHRERRWRARRAG